MKKFANAIIGLVIVSILPIQASLINQEVLIERLYPTENTYFTPSVTTTVKAGTADQVSPQPSLYTINIESENIYFDFTNVSAFEGTASKAPFDGLRFSGFTNTILEAEIVDSKGISIVGLEHTDKSILLNLHDWFHSDAFINIKVKSTDASNVPEPNSFLLILAGAITLTFLLNRSKGSLKNK